MIEKTYRVVILGETGMYSCGPDAKSPELAMEITSGLSREKRLAIEEVWWENNRIDRCVIISAEKYPGEYMLGQKQAQAKLSKYPVAEIKSAKEAMEKALYFARRSGYYHERNESISEAYRQISDGYALLSVELRDKQP